MNIRLSFLLAVVMLSGIALHADEATVITPDTTVISPEASTAPSLESLVGMVQDVTGFIASAPATDAETADLATGLAFLEEKLAKPDLSTMQSLTNAGKEGTRIALALSAAIGSRLLIDFIKPSNAATTSKLRLASLAAILGTTCIAVHQLTRLVWPNTEITYSDILTDFFEHWTEYQALIPADYLSTLSTAYNGYIANGRTLPITEKEAKNLVRTIKYDVKRRRRTPDLKAFFMKI